MSTPAPPAPSTPTTHLVRPALLVAGVILLAANLRAGITVMSPLLGEVRSDLDLTSSATALLISLPVVCFAVFSPLVPKLASRLGIEQTLALALSVLTVGVVLRSVPWGPGLWLGTALLGASVAAINVLLPSLLKRDFPTRIGPMTGMYSAFQSAFAALASGVAVPLAGLPGWSWRTAAGATAALAFIALAVFLPQLTAAIRHRSTPPATAASAAHPAASGTTAPQHGAPHTPLWRSAVAWQVAAFMGLQSAFFYVVLTWWPSIEQAAGVSVLAAGLHMALLQAASIGGNLVAGWALRTFNPRWVSGLPGAGVALAFLGMFAWPSVSLLWSLLFGFFSGMSIVAALSVFGARTRSPERAAALSGMAQTFGYLLAAAMPPLLGTLHDSTGSWLPVLLVQAAFGVGAAVFGWLSARDRVVD